MIYNPERFFMSKMYYLEDKSKLFDSDAICQFVQSSIIGELHLYWEREKLPKQKYSEKIVGEDFEKRILESGKNAIVLFYHPIKDKNRNVCEQFEHFAEADSKKHKNLIVGRYNGINESE